MITGIMASGKSTVAELLAKEFPKSVNNADAETISALYADNAVNHQVVNQPVEGKAAIRAMFEAEFAAAEMVCIPENLFEHTMWSNVRGLR